MSFAICFNLDQSKIWSSGNGLSNNKFVIWKCGVEFAQVQKIIILIELKSLKELSVTTKAQT